MCVHEQNFVVIMEEIGTLTLARTKFFNTLYVYHCVRVPGYVLEFSHRKGSLFHCCGCKRSGKTRCITVINSAIVPGTKHPEDDHHPRCQPVEQSGDMFSFVSCACRSLTRAVKRGCKNLGF